MGWRACLSIAFLYGLMAVAGCTQTISFKVIDAVTGEPVAGVHARHGEDGFNFLGLGTFRVWDTQTSGADGIIKFADTRTGGHFNLNSDTVRTGSNEEYYNNPVVMQTWPNVEYLYDNIYYGKRRIAAKDPATGAYVLPIFPRVSAPALGQ